MCRRDGQSEVIDQMKPRRLNQLRKVEPGNLATTAMTSAFSRQSKSLNRSKLKPKSQQIMTETSAKLKIMTKKKEKAQ